MQKKISLFTFVMITLSLIISLRGLPMLAKHGLSSMFFYSFSALFFLIPVGLIAAELATAWPEKGGIFLWVSKAFGDKWGFVATFLQWIPIVIWYPTILSFVSAAFAYLIDPALAENKYFILIMILIIYWSATFINFKGLKVSGIISTLAVSFGTIFPAFIIVLFGALWLILGHPSQISFSPKDLFPDFSSLNNLVFLAGAFLLYGGIEISAVHINDMDQPQKNYPKALFISTIMILAVSILGTLSVAIVIPNRDISLVSGVFQAFSYFFEAFNLSFLTYLFAFFIGLGALGQISSMILGPTKAMLESANRKDLPPFFKKVNKNGIPVNILIVQGVIVTIFSMVFLLLPSVSGSYWILSVLVIQLYLLMYVFLYASAIRLRYKFPDVKRPFKIFKNNFGIWTIAIIGILVELFVYLISFIPPSDVATGSSSFFLWFLILGNIVFILIPLIIYKNKKRWTTE